MSNLITKETYYLFLIPFVAVFLILILSLYDLLYLFKSYKDKWIFKIENHQIIFNSSYGKLIVTADNLSEIELIVENKISYIKIYLKSKNDLWVLNKQNYMQWLKLTVSKRIHKCDLILPGYLINHEAKELSLLLNKLKNE